jgi:excisionase family DNA binding protein
MTTLLTPREVAARLHVAPRTVYAWIEQGRLPVVKLSERVTRIPEGAVDALVAEATRSATNPAPTLAGGVALAAESSPAYGAVAASAAIVAPPHGTRTPSERLRDLLMEHRDEVLRIVSENRAGNVRVFGSVARGDATEDSDIDLLVDPQPGMSLFDLGGIDWRLEELLGVKVDIVPARSLRERIRDRVLAEAYRL